MAIDRIPGGARTILRFLIVGHFATSGALYITIPFAKMLEKLGHKVDILSTYPVNGFESVGITVSCTPSLLCGHWFGKLRAVLPFAALNARMVEHYLLNLLDSYDCVVSYSGEYWSHSRLLGLKERLKKPLIIYDLPDFLPFNFPGRIYRYLYNQYVPFLFKYFRAADAIISLNRIWELLLHKYFGVSKDKLLVIPPIVDLDKFSPKPHLLRDHEKVVLLLGHARYFPNETTALIKALGKLSREFSLKIISVGNVGRWWEELLKRNDILHKTTILRSVPHALMPELINSSHICPLFFPRDFLNLPYRLMEFLACGKIVITCRFIGAAELLNDKNSILIKDCTVEQYYNGIKAALTKDTGRLTKKARKTVEQLIGGDEIRHRIEELLNVIKKS